MRLASFSWLSYLLLFAVFLGSFALRTYLLDSVPYGFFCDEASVGYNAYSILTTGRDEWGEVYPLFFRAFGEYKNPILTYSVVPSIFLFGLSEFATRLPSAVYGALGVAGIFVLTYVLFSKKYAFCSSSVAALLLAISPWHIHMSRVALEGISAFVFFFTVAVALYLLKERKVHFLFLSILFFAFALYSYFPARIFVPLFVIGVLIYEWRYFIQNARTSFLSLVFSIMLCLPLLLHFFSGDGASRFQQVSIFSESGFTLLSAHHILVNYISHFSLDFLFLKGDVGMDGQFITRHSVRGIGELYLFQLPFILLGLYYFFRREKKRPFFILSLWLLLYPVGSIFTLDTSAQATRSVIGVVPFQILTAAGVVFVFRFLRTSFQKLSFIFLFSALTTISCLYFFRLYFYEYPHYSSDFWGWQYGPREIVQYFSDHGEMYDQTLMEGAFNAPYIFFKFYAPGECKTCMLGVPHENYDPNLHQLFAVTPHYLESNPTISLRVLRNVYYPDGTVAFVIGEVIE